MQKSIASRLEILSQKVVRTLRANPANEPQAQNQLSELVKLLNSLLDLYGPDGQPLAQPSLYSWLRKAELVQMLVRH